MTKITNLDVGRIRGLMRNRAMGTTEVGYKMGVAPSVVTSLLSKGEAPAELAARMAMVLGVTITEISTV